MNRKYLRLYFFLFRTLDLDFSYAGFLVDELNCDLKLFKKLFKDFFGSEYDDIQTEKMFKGAKRDLKQSTGTLIQILQEKNLKHIIFLINSISRLTEVKELSPERVIQERNQVVQYFNKQHSVIDMGGKIVVMKSYYNPELETHSRILNTSWRFSVKAAALDSSLNATTSVTSTISPTF